jgi:hypothetical protein
MKEAVTGPPPLFPTINWDNFGGLQFSSGLRIYPDLFALNPLGNEIQHMEFQRQEI